MFLAIYGKAYADWAFLSNSDHEVNEWKNTLTIPFAVAAFSLLVLFFQVLWDAWSRTHFDPGQEVKSDMSHAVDSGTSMRKRLTDLIGLHGGSIILSFKILRLFGCLVLLILSIFDPFDSGERQPLLLSRSMLNMAISSTYFYCLILAAGAIFGGAWSPTLSYHNDLVLMASFAIFAYRDLWPLATYSGTPADGSRGLILWVEIAILMLVSVGFFLFIPRQYTPVKVEDPMEIPNPEQTASIFSRMFFIYMDPIVVEASRVPHLSHARVPPLPDYLSADHLVRLSFPHLDTSHGAQKQHLFFGLFRVFWRDFSVMSTIIVLQAVSNFLSPIALNKLLVALEANGHSSNVRPWFWVLCLFLARISMSLCWQGYGFVATTVVARTQAILTELIFEHCLRIRLKTRKDDEGDSFRGERNTVMTSTDIPSKNSGAIGNVTTMVTVDVSTIAGGKDFLMIVIQGPLELVFAAIFLFKLLGWSAFVGFMSTLLLLPVPGYIGSKVQSIHSGRMKKTVIRVQSVAEILDVIRMVKMFGWEAKMRETLSASREAELDLLWKEKLINLINDVVNFVIPTITMVATYGTYTWIAKEKLSAAKVFPTIAVFEIVRGLLRRTSFLFSLAVKGKVSLDRISQFLSETELLDKFDDSNSSLSTISPIGSSEQGTIGFYNSEFVWSKEKDNDTIDSSQTFRLRIEGQVVFKRGAMNMIVGPTGSGKTSILMALLGEMHFIPTSGDSWYNLPRGGGVAYAAQEYWVQNDTIKNNILFGLPYDEERYRKVIHQCALTRDLDIFDAGGDTEVGERGITLSGGQKARVTLARAVYSSASILLLDDIFAALDVHTSKWIVEKCLQGSLVRGRTVLLITHNIGLVSPIAEHVVSVDLDGVVHEIGRDRNDALASDSILSSEVQHLDDDDSNEVVEEVLDRNPSVKEQSPAVRDGKLILAEEIAEGHVSRKSYMLFLGGLGGDRPFLFLTAWMTGLALMHGGSMLAVWFLGYWGHQYELRGSSEVHVPYYLFIYSSILFVSIAIYSLAMIGYNYGTQRASRKISNELVGSILSSTFQWLDKTPVSRIITRCSQDIATIDDGLPDSFAKVVDMGIAVAIKLGGPVLLTPVFFFPGVLVTALGVYLGNVYLRAQMCMMRESSNARAPVLAHFGATFAGLISIRAYGAEESFKAESLRRIDHYTKVTKTSYDLNRWIGIRIDLLSAVFASALAGYLMYEKSLSASDAGFSLTMALEFCALVLGLVRSYNFLEVDSNSLERIQTYLDVEHEPVATESGKPPAAWPTSGDLRVDNLSARYSETSSNVLHDLTFHVRAGERIGIVGRTGSGKSSLMLSLLRLIHTDGVVYYDGLPTNEINLEALRLNISIIPQTPELVSGTLRRNLDPFEQHTDAALIDALRAAGLFRLRELEVQAQEVRSSTSESLTLDTPIASGGLNVSLGQQQIIALARALLRRCKVLILDEATSAIDHETDTIIQSSLRNQLGRDVTVLIVAHRVQTVMDADNIMVLDEGKIVEYDTPQNLLQKPGGYFRSLVDDGRKER